MPAPGGLSVPASYLRLGERTNGRPFGPSEAVGILGKGAPTYVGLSQLVRAGWLFRLSRGRYATVDPLVRFTPRLERNLRPYRSRCFYPILYQSVGAALRVFPGLEGLLLFGSSARGTSGPESDLDILAVVEERPASIYEEANASGRVASASAGLRLEEYESVGHLHRVQVALARPASFSNPGPLMYEISRDGKVLYDGDGKISRGQIELREVMNRQKVRRTVLPGGSVVWDRQMRARAG